ncbi:hypothetical protein MNBD_CHLOROFLEXI01-318 [hydrothermal vent metagenome]|uniref:Uncharacterized protein n=1 Tax=hydrothermal vent metagenome TaxID=652676 RepID=A0A3B0W0Q0_9ZZZZ
MDLRSFAPNWKALPDDPELRKRLYGQFDAVTFMDTVEHYVPSKYRQDLAMQGDIYGSMFAMAQKLLKPASDSNRLFISCLHMIKSPRTFADHFSCYLQTRFHSGFYPSGDDGLTQWSATRFSEIARYDKMEDYRLTSVLDDKHFGSPKIRWNLKKRLTVPLLFLLDPHHLHKWLEWRTGAWMWHFGADALRPEYDNAYQKPLRFVTLWWLILQRKPENSYL